MFRSEADLRRWVRNQNIDPIWVEPTRGSTSGHPDLWFSASSGVTTFVELKVGEVKDGRLLFEVRPAQKALLRKMKIWRLPVFFIVGEKDGLRVWAVAIDRDSLNGVAILGDETARELKWDDPSAILLGACSVGFLFR